MRLPVEVPRRAAISVAVAAFVAVVVAALVMCYGVIEPPSFPSLAKKPDPALTGYVAFANLVQERDGDNEPRVCIDVVPASGGPRRRVHCDTGTQYSYRFVWTSDGRLAVLGTLLDRRYEIKLIDPRDGKVVQRVPNASSARFTDFDNSRDREARFESSTEDGKARLSRRSTDGTRTTLISVKAPESYRFGNARLSPDGTRLLFTDSSGHILVADADGSDVRVLTTRREGSYGEPRWFQPGRSEDTTTVEEILGRRPAR